MGGAWWGGAGGDEGLFLPGRGEETSDWSVEIGYQGDFDTLEEEAVGEAKDLGRHLPRSAIYPT